MKTVSGKVISTKSISLKKAAKTLSNFASSDNGAPPAFAAYLRRASDSFNELVQLHKDSKLLGSEQRMKKRPSKDLSERTYESAISNGAKGLVKEMAINKRKESRGGNKGEEEAERNNVRTEMKTVEGIVDVNGLKNETESFDGSKDTQKKKKKKKRDELTSEEYDVEVDTEKLKQRLSNSENSDGNKELKKMKKRENYENVKSGHINEATRAMENAGDDQKIYKKSKKDKLKEASFGSGINDDEQRDERSKVRRNVETVDKKTQMYEGKERKHEDNLEIEVPNNNESRKRKHESVVAQGLDSSQEQHKSKKKKR